MADSFWRGRRFEIETSDKSLTEWLCANRTQTGDAHSLLLAIPIALNFIASGEYVKFWPHTG
ncbi:hypothetical protein OnM2_045023 [Erysiphe neolycopersici]|uniref:Uncharacterized protein n=1 Tax=Erysiphe neolycopersici TaxID=212602 RepID=A0A420HUH8_9PEZI|nr:hypothetical protein OnM2_045023 [Erysiphe neolycopersici]